MRYAVAVQVFNVVSMVSMLLAKSLISRKVKGVSRNVLRTVYSSA